MKMKTTTTKQPRPIADAHARLAWLETFIGTVRAECLSEPAVVDDMEAHWRINPTAAEKFWRIAFTRMGERTPERDLGEVMRFLRLGLYTERTYRTRAKQAWAAFCERERVKAVRRPSKAKQPA